MTFFGLKGPPEQKKFLRALKQIQSLYDNYFTADMMMVFQKNMGFVNENDFQAAHLKNSLDETEQGRIWRMHIAVWCAEQCLNVDGDFVECGTFRGLTANMVLDLVDLGDRHFYLYDTFEGIPEGYGTEEELRVLNQVYAKYTNLHEAVKLRFREYKQAVIVKGILPDVLEKECPEKISFLHLDMNSEIGEVLTFKALWDKVQTGGMILFDDYGQSMFKNMHLKEKEFAMGKGHTIMEIPTGQGVLLRHGTE